MFNGIITHLGKVKTIKQSRYSFSTDRDFFKKLGKGSSVAINGICLTLDADPTADTFSIEVMPETVKKTSISTLKIGGYVNLELPMSVNSLFAGHIVQGHIDGTGKITAITPRGNSHIFTIQVKPELEKYMINKGSVAVNGISLTIMNTKKEYFTVGIIPYTFKHTTMQYSKIGDVVNIEVDVLAKYVEKFLGRKEKS